MEIRSERLAYWFFRLNGFLTITNFVVHRDDGYGQHTDVDVLAVRFPHRVENQVQPMQDEPRLQDEARIQIVLAEAKAGVCAFNRTWLDPEFGNLGRILAAVGPFPSERLKQVSESLYSTGEWGDDKYWVRLVALGVRRNRQIANGRLAGVPQFQWREDVLPFIHHRFWTYRYEKRHHNQWDDDAKNLFSSVIRHGEDVAMFVRDVNVID